MKRKQKRLNKLAKELALERERKAKEQQFVFQRNYVLGLAYSLGIVRIVAKRKPFPDIQTKSVNSLDWDSPCSTYQAYVLVDDRVALT